MPYDEELVRLNNGDPKNNEKKKKENMNGWRGPSTSTSPPPKLRKARLVAKDGETLLSLIQLPRRFQICYRNWFHLIIEQEWRTILLIFTSGFFCSWAFFGVLYYAISVRTMPRDDSEIAYITQTGSVDASNVTKPKICIEKVYTLVDALLFSMESQHTIGYGYRYMTNECPPAYTILMVQLVVGCFLQTMLAGIVVAKVLRPKKRKQEIRFSKRAVVGPVDEHDHRPALMIRLADIQQNLYLAESHVRMYMASSRINKHGDRELVGVKDMNVGYDSGWDRVLLLWPIIIRHIIDEESPLFGLTKESLQVSNFELIMTVEGIVEATGMTFQARTSFQPEEILWGHRFTPMILMNEKNQKWEVHYGLFDQVERCGEIDTPCRLAETEDSHDEEDEHHMVNKSGFM
ncbi:unnamed protein product, partial [Mesorhabditis belari]|uniref:Uncharacterized protein n=1 Tax=Mesorhabditis belari TaxID=2138241 RepID=A0AAF3EHC2_9BILA